MDAITCTQAQNWVQQAIQTRQSAPPGLYLHIANCPICRPALALLMAKILDMPPVSTHTTCTVCKEDLAAFIDAEEADALDALRDYSHVWWHLWQCSACAETYELTRDLLLADQHGQFTTQATTNPVRVRESFGQVLLRLTRAYLNLALPVPSPELGAARGEISETVVYESPPGADQYISLAMEQHPDTSWNIFVHVKPPISGWARVQIGPHLYNAPFNSDGLATMAAVPSAILATPDGPGLIVSATLDHSTTLDTAP